MIFGFDTLYSLFFIPKAYIIVWFVYYSIFWVHLRENWNLILHNFINEIKTIQICRDSAGNSLKYRNIYFS